MASGRVTVCKTILHSVRASIGVRGRGNVEEAADIWVLEKHGVIKPG